MQTRCVQRRLPAGAVLVALACATIPGPGVRPVAEPPGAIVVTESGAAVTPTQLAELLGDRDVIFFGERHGDSAVHATEALLLEALAAAGRSVVVSLEMFERDAQPLLDSYLSGRVSETAFLAASRPWRRYATDYRPLIEMARAQGWPVRAANAPRPTANAVSRSGLDALQSLTPAERRHVAAEVHCPADSYRERFFEAMRSHPPAADSTATGALPDSVAQRFYLAQCVKDETMAESIVQALRGARPGTVIVHFTGAFHADYRQGTVERVLRRQPALRVAVISVAGKDNAGLNRPRADYLVVTASP